MMRRSSQWPLGGLLVLAAVIGLTAVAVPETGSVERNDDPPNVIVVMTDDQPTGMLHALPRTRELVGGAGVSFDNYYVSYPLCCPSRATYLTGQYAHNNGVAHNGPPLGGYQRLAEADALPVWLREAGYVTSHIGKYPNGYGRDDPHNIPSGWDEWRGAIDPTTYWMYGYTLNENGRLRTYGDRREADPRFYQTDVYRRKAVDFVERMSGRKRPFFLSLAFLAPHDEGPLWKTSGLGAPGLDTNAARLRKRQEQLEQKRNGAPRKRAWVEPAPRPAPRHEGAFAHAQLPNRPSYDEPRLGDKPAYLRGYPELPKRTQRQILASYRGRLASLLSVDEAVAALVRTLERTGELDNTYLMFVSDNGYFFGEHRVPMGKFLPHDASSHAPLMIRGPGIPAGRTSHELVSNPDLAATIADAADVRPQLPQDGRSLLPYAEHPARLSGRPVLHEAGGGAVVGNDLGVWSAADNDAGGRAAGLGDLDQDPALSAAVTELRLAPAHGQVRSIAYEAIRTRRYLYVRYLGGGRELYDLKHDPYELRSRDESPAYADTEAFLDERLDELQGCAGEACSKPIPRSPRPDPSKPDRVSNPASADRHSRGGGSR
jgi:N-acetylglucosamine-6-sulfatase